jgi:hypothetical protein
MGRLDQPIQRSSYDDAFKRSVAALRDADIPFACMGSTALWALGGPQPNLQQDLDFAICEADVDRALEAFEDAGFATQRPPEDWLVKAWSGEVEGAESALVDLIFAPAGVHITEELLRACDRRNVLAMTVPVLSPTDLMVTKLASITESNADYSSTLQFARSLREKIDWHALQSRVGRMPFGAAFLELVDGLGLSSGGTAMRQGTDVVRHRLADQPSASVDAVPFANFVSSDAAAARLAAELAGEPVDTIVARLGQAIAEDERSATLDIRVVPGPGCIVLRGESGNHHHRAEVEAVVRELVPHLEVENHIRVREYAAPHDDPESIG